MFLQKSQIVLFQELLTPYTTSLIAPKIKVSFDVSSALGAGIDSGNNCLMWPEEPVVTISLTE